MYLYIFEDGSCVQLSDPPSSDDLRSIEDRFLDVIVFVDGFFKRVEPDGGLTIIRQEFGNC